ncbi:MAG: DUF3830 family protein [Sphingobacteriales bacterium]|nr:MAG: DUF3830 family protein [Sphingobacteriales bacterium]
MFIVALIFNANRMAQFKIITADSIQIKFNLYSKDAPITCKAFIQLLPFTKTFFHARVSGQEIWTDDLTPLYIIQENASVFTQPGEVVLGPAAPARVKTVNCLGIYYGEGKGLDAANIFAKVAEEDAEKLKQLGNQVWRKGETSLTFSIID